LAALTLNRKLSRILKRSIILYIKLVVDTTDSKWFLFSLVLTKHYVAEIMRIQNPIVFFANAILILIVAVFFQTNSLQAQTVSLTVVDESYALYDGLVRELRRGGYVIYMRHGSVQAGSTDTRGQAEWWKNCATTQRTSAAVLPNAQAVGLALSKQRIVVSDVQTSEFCRAYETAIFLGLSSPLRNAALNDITAFNSQKRSLADLAGGITTLLSTVPPQGQNRILVGHTLPPTIVHPLLTFVQEGHTLIFKPEGNGRFHFVAALSPSQWQFIGKQPVYDNQQIVIQSTVPQASAQIAQAPQVVQPPQVTNAAPQPPMIDPAREIKGQALIAALRKGGFNLYMRHAQSNVGADQDLLKVPMWWENCMIQRNMSDMGREQAKKVGAAIRDLKLPIAEVKASQFCRVQETAKLMDVGIVKMTQDLNHVIGQNAGTDINSLRFAQLATMPPKGKNVVMVSHTHGSARNEERIMSGIQEAEIVVYQPDGKGGSEPIARIPPTDWDMLVQLATNIKGK
jgi:phosphohistidine phosphatase SixA